MDKVSEKGFICIVKIPVLNLVIFRQNLHICMISFLQIKNTFQTNLTLFQQISGLKREGGMGLIPPHFS